ncbi:hypothetical protein C8N39_11138 [Dietzia psychralcaliphila]|nr:hypothetical protein C8N39_11138 [Dietzia psychralcaliphila]
MNTARDAVGRRSEIFFGHDIKTIHHPGSTRQEGGQQ